MEGDFKTYYISALLAKEGNIHDIYNNDAFSQKTSYVVNLENPKNTFLRYINLPLVAYFFIPLTFLSIQSAYRVYALILLITQLLCLVLLGKFYKSNKWIIILAISLPIFFGGIYYGQISPIILMILVMILYFLHQKNDIVSGLLSGLLIIKLQMILLIPFIFILSKNKKIFSICTTISLFFYLALNLLIFGSNLFTQYFNYLFLHKLETNDGYLFNFFVFYKHINIIILLVFTIICLLISLYFIYRRYKQGYSIKILLPISIIISTIFNIHTMYTDLLYLLIPLFLYFSIKDFTFKIIFLSLFLLVILFSISNFQYISVLILFLIAILSLYQIKYLA